MREIVEQKMKEVVDLLKHSVSREEFLDAFKGVTEYAKKIESKLENKLDAKVKNTEDRLSELAQLHENTIKQIENDNTSTLSNVKRWANEAVAKLFIKSRINDKIGEVDARLSELSQMKAPDVTTVALEASKLAHDKLLPLIPTIPTISEKPTLKALLEEDDGEIDWDFLKGLKETMESVKQELAQTKTFTLTAMGAQGGGRIVKVLDLTTQLDGSTKVFTVQTMWRIIAVNFSSFPYVARPTIDYVYNASANTITFTNEIDAASTLAVGQTVTITYSE